MECALAQSAIDSSLARRFVLAIGLVALVLFLWFARDALLLGFGGVLLGLLLSAAADRFSGWTRLPRAWTLSLTVAASIVLASGLAWMFGKQIAKEFAYLATTLPEMAGQLRDRIESTTFGQMVEQTTTQGHVASESDRSIAAAVVGFARSLFEGVGNLLLVVFAGVYFAAQPDLYVKGALRLVPPGRRQRAMEVFVASGHALRHWILGQLAAMTLVGLLTGLGLWLLDIPAAFALAAIAAAAEFVPIIGPIVAAVPAILMALSVSNTAAVYVAVLYLVIQQVESYILYPLIQREAVSLPPVVTLFAIVAFTIVLGPLGAVFATPLAVILMVLVRMLYVEDALGDRPLKDAPRP
jgi:predicted PurR-regulated permease PerM